MTPALLIKSLAGLIAALVLLTGSIVAYLNAVPGISQGGSPPGITALVATSSVHTVLFGSVITIFDGVNSSGFARKCAARIVTTVERDILIAFGEVDDNGNYAVASTTLANGIGHLQLASTTVVYDSGLYGCGTMSLRSFIADSQVTITETY